MKEKLYTISKKDLFDLFARLSESHKVFVPYKNREQFVFGEFSQEKEDMIELGGIRQTQPFKSFLNPVREAVLDSSRRDGRSVIVAGVKGCDLSSLILQDFVFLKGDHEDPFYAAHRNATLIIGHDCTFAKETCFCVAMDGAPYPRAYFDINLSPIDASFLVEIGSEKGKALIDRYKTFFKEVRSGLEDKRDQDRGKVASQIRDFIQKRGTPDTAQIKGTVKKTYNRSEFWQDFASTCVECGACNLVCPTCHCFLLYDQKREERIGRTRIWDACLYNTFARVAGGANPRRHLYERLRNRFDKKFAFFPEILNYTACTGCGRCIEACPGDIDLREVLKGLVLGTWNKPPHD